MDWNGGIDYGIFVYTDGTLCSTIDNRYHRNVLSMVLAALSLSTL